METVKVRAKRLGGPRALSRSENMRAVRARNTAPELELRRLLSGAGLRGYRLHPQLPGHPDVAFLGRRIAIFLDGCYWHGCPLHYSAPATRMAFWAAKLRANVLRDAAVDAALRDAGWVSIHVWQHELRDPARVVERVRSALAGPRASCDHPDSDCASRSFPLTTSCGGWHACSCGSDDVQVLEVSGHGSIRPDAEHRVSGATFRCRVCGTEWYVQR